MSTINLSAMFPSSASSSTAPTLGSTLLAYYQARDAASGVGAAANTNPTAPWNLASAATTTPAKTSTGAASTGGVPSSTVTAANTLAASLLGGTALIDPAAAKLNVSTNSATANDDYKNLFALYQGLTSLQTLTSAAGSTSISSGELAQLQKAFASGLTQVQSFMTANPFKEFKVADGTVTANDQTTVGAPQSTSDYTTAVRSSSVNLPVASFQGDVRFSMTVDKLHQTPIQVSFNLADMGATPRTLSNVVSYLNAQLKVAGVATRFSNELLPSTAPAASAPSGAKSSGAQTTGGTTPTPAPQFALTVKGSAVETVSFTAATTSPAVYVAETSTSPSSGSTSTTAASSSGSKSPTTPTPAAAPAPTSQLLKLDPTGAHAVNSSGKVWTDNLPSGANVQASQTASDGSVYVLADVTATTNGQTLQGSQDVALLKYDTAGNLLYTRTLGAPQSASGYALAVSTDGSQVAVAGSVKGTLDPTNTAAAASGTAQSFVTVYGAAAGDELWSQNQTGTAANQVNAVAFGANNTVYVAGTTQSKLPSGSSAGGQDAYVQAFTATQTKDLELNQMVWTAKSSFTQEFGTTGADRATGVAVNGNALYVSSVENGDAVVRQYDVSAPGAPTLAAKQDLGNLQGGNLAGVAIGANGAVIVAGTTHDGTLNAGTVSSAYTGGSDGFVAQLSSTLDPTASEHLAYYSGGHDTTITGLAFQNGSAYFTGQIATGASASGARVSELGYAAEMDPITGQVAWSQTLQGSQGNAAPVAIAVTATGSSALDALGLPQGAIGVGQSSSVVANTSLRPGDEFFVQVGQGARTAVSVAAQDTYATLAHKIQLASGFELAASTTTDSTGAQQLKLDPTNKSTTTTVAIEAGPSGRDALGGLGLKAGLVTNTSSYVGSTPPGVKSAVKGAYTVNVPTTLSLSSPQSVAAAATQISTAIAEVQSIYYDMSRAKTVAPGTSSANNSALIAFYNNQAAANRNALARLGG